MTASIIILSSSTVNGPCLIIQSDCLEPFQLYCHLLTQSILFLFKISDILFQCIVGLIAPLPRAYLLGSEA